MRPATLITAALAVVAATAPAAHAVRFSNTANIELPGAGPASTYPSEIQVAGLSGPVTQLEVSFDVFARDEDRLGVLLQGPTGEALPLIQKGPGMLDFPRLTFTDSASEQLPFVTELDGGTRLFQPTSHFTGADYTAPGPGTAFANPGPAGGGAATLGSTFGGTSPNGTWKLFAYNFQSPSDPTLVGGWQLRLAGFDQFTLGGPKIGKSRRRGTIPATLPGPGRVMIDDPMRPGVVAAGPKGGKKKPPGLFVDRTMAQIATAGTVQLPLKIGARSRRVLARKGRVNIPIRVIYYPKGELGTVKRLTVKVKDPPG